MVYTYAQLEQLWIANGGSQATAPMAAAIALGESSGDPQATAYEKDGSISRGLWQINSVHGSHSTYDVNANAAYAVQLYNSVGNWTPWGSYTDGRYLQYLQGNSSGGSPVSGTTQVGTSGDATGTSDVSAQPVGFFGDIWDGIKSIFTGQAGADIAGALGKGIANGFAAVLKAVLMPFILLIWWSMEVILGFIITGIAVWILIKRTDTFKAVEGTVEDAAIMAGPPPVKAVAAAKKTVAVKKEQKQEEKQTAKRNVTTVKRAAKKTAPMPPTMHGKGRIKQSENATRTQRESGSAIVTELEGRRKARAAMEARQNASYGPQNRRRRG